MTAPGGGDTETVKSTDVESLQRKLARRERKIDKLTSGEQFVRLANRIKELEADVGIEKEAHEQTRSRLSISEERGKTQDKTIAALHKQVADAKADVVTKTLANKFGKGRPKVSRWSHHHPVNGGKRVPDEDNEKQAARFRKLNVKEKGVEVQRGDVLLLITGSKCFGYEVEAGSNIVVAPNSSLPHGVSEAVIDDVNNAMPDVSKYTRREKHAERFFDEYVTRSVYSLFEGLQGPVYINGKRPVYKAGWANNETFDRDTILALQPDLISAIMRSGLTISKLNVFAQETQKSALLATLNRIAANQTKMAFSTQSNRGRAPKKFVLPEDLKASGHVRGENSKVALTPPAAADNVKSPRIGEMYKKQKVEPNKTKTVGRKAVGSSPESPPISVQVGNVEETSKRSEVVQPHRKQAPTSKRAAMDKGTNKIPRKKRRLQDGADELNKAFTDTPSPVKSNAVTEAMKLLKEMDHEQIRNLKRKLN